jgi:hypothetical protein
MTSPEQLAGKFIKAADGIKFSQRDGVNEAGKVMQFAVNANVKMAIGANQELSGVPGGKIEAKLLTAASDVKPTAIAKGVPAGLFTIVESGALPHVVGAQTARGRSIGRGYGLDDRGRVLRTLKSGRDVRSRVAGRKLMSGGEWAAYGPFIAGGSRGKRPFASAYKTVAPRVAELVQRKTSAALVKAFR